MGDQAEDIVNSVITAGGAQNDAGKSNNNDNLIESFLNVFNNIADGINEELNDTTIEDVVALLEIISGVLTVLSFTGIPQVILAKAIIDAITGVANFIIENNNQEDVANDSNESITDSSTETNTITSIFNSVTES